MNELKESEDLPSKESKNCVNCKHCYIPEDFLLGYNLPEMYCNFNKDRPTSGCVLTDPFDYYDSSTYFGQLSDWNIWSEIHKVGTKNYCEVFERTI